MKTRVNLGPTIACAAVFLGVGQQVALGDLGGDKAVTVRYICSENTGEVVTCTVDLDIVAFPLSSWQGKYRLVRARIENRRNAPVAFSSTKDVVQATIGEKNVSACLVPSAVVPELWDKLNARARLDLAYPKALPADGAIYVYLFFPADELTAVPDEFSWRIASLDATLVIRPRQTADR